MELNLLLPCFGLSALFQLFVLANTWLCLKAHHHSTTVHKTCPNILVGSILNEDASPPPFLSRYVFCIYALISPLSTLYPLSALSNIYFPLSTLHSPLSTLHSSLPTPNSHLQSPFPWYPCWLSLPPILCLPYWAARNSLRQTGLRGGSKIC